jgi:transcriptional regulator with XRE-family HTH domain
MSQAELARAAGTRERNIVRWENEHHAPRLENIIRIADSTNKPVQFFFADRGDVSQAASREDEAMEKLRPFIQFVMAGQS